MRDNIRLYVTQHADLRGLTLSAQLTSELQK